MSSVVCVGPKHHMGVIYQQRTLEAIGVNVVPWEEKRMKTECDKNLLGGEDGLREGSSRRTRMRSLNEEESVEMQKPGKEKAGGYEE